MQYKDMIKTESGRTLLEMLGVLVVLIVLTIGGVYMFGSLYSNAVAKALTESVMAQASVRKHEHMKRTENLPNAIDVDGPHGYTIHVEDGTEGTLGDTFWVSLNVSTSMYRQEICDKLLVRGQQLLAAQQQQETVTDTKDWLGLIELVVDEEIVKKCAKNVREVRYIFTKTRTPDGDPNVCISGCPKCRLCPKGARCEENTITCLPGYKKEHAGTCQETCTKCTGRECCPNENTINPDEAQEGHKPNDGHTDCPCCNPADSPSLCGCTGGLSPNGSCGCGCSTDADCAGTRRCNSETRKCECKPQTCGSSEYWDQELCKCRKVYTKCGNDADCERELGPGWKCSALKICQPDPNYCATSCESNADCTAPATCVSGCCKAPTECTNSCSSDADCTAPETCVSGCCKAICPGPNPCPPWCPDPPCPPNPFVCKTLCSSNGDCTSPETCVCDGEDCCCKTSGPDPCPGPEPCPPYCPDPPCPPNPFACTMACESNADCLSPETCVCSGEDCCCMGACSNPPCPECKQLCTANTDCAAGDTCLCRGNDICCCETPCNESNPCPSNMMCSDAGLCVCPDGMQWSDAFGACICGENQFVSEDGARCLDCPADATAEAGTDECVCNTDGIMWDRETNTCAPRECLYEVMGTEEDWHQREITCGRINHSMVQNPKGEGPAWTSPGRHWPCESRRHALTRNMILERQTNVCTTASIDWGGWSFPARTGSSVLERIYVPTVSSGNLPQCGCPLSAGYNPDAILVNEVRKTCQYYGLSGGACDWTFKNGRHSEYGELISTAADEQAFVAKHGFCGACITDCDCPDGAQCRGFYCHDPVDRDCPYIGKLCNVEDGYVCLSGRRATTNICDVMPNPFVKRCGGFLCEPPKTCHFDESGNVVLPYNGEVCCNFGGQSKVDLLCIDPWIAELQADAIVAPRYCRIQVGRDDWRSQEPGCCPRGELYDVRARECRPVCPAGYHWEWEEDWPENQ